MYKVVAARLLKNKVGAKVASPIIYYNLGA